MTACDPSVWGARAVRAPRPCKPYGAGGVPARRPFRLTWPRNHGVWLEGGCGPALFDELAPVTPITPPRESTHCPLAHPRQE